jgi:hypothetical protein
MGFKASGAYRLTWVGVGDRTQVWRHRYTGFLLATYGIDHGTIWLHERLYHARLPAPLPTHRGLRKG